MEFSLEVRFIVKENAFEIVICKVAAILFRIQYLKWEAQSSDTVILSVRKQCMFVQQMLKDNYVLIMS